MNDPHFPPPDPPKPPKPPTLPPKVQPATTQPPTTQPPKVQPATTQPPNAQPPMAPKAGSAAASNPPSAVNPMAPIQRLGKSITDEIHKLYVGQEDLVAGCITALLAGGHVLLESVPGLGKTLFVRTLGRVLGCECGRIQFTADLMPSDITGAPVFDMQASEFRFRPGPVFTQFLLADEINRSPAKTHAALLEIMQENRVTIDGQTHPVPKPFLVLATQNPLESEGTYNLPEAQLDRFMFKLRIDYPSADQESQILKLHSEQIDLNQRLIDEVQTVTEPKMLIAAMQRCAKVRTTDALVDYITAIVRTTRTWPAFHAGASPRAGLTIVQTARVRAALDARDFATPDDVADVVLPALRHRVQLTAEAEIEGRAVDDELRSMLSTIAVPRD